MAARASCGMAMTTDPASLCSKRAPGAPRDRTSARRSFAAFAAAVMREEAASQEGQ